MKLSVMFYEHDRGNCRVYYKGMGEAKGRLYCVQEGVWMFCSKDGEPEAPLKDGVEITIHDSSGIIGNKKVGG